MSKRHLVLEISVQFLTFMRNFNLNISSVYWRKHKIGHGLKKTH